MLKLLIHSVCLLLLCSTSISASAQTNTNQLSLRVGASAGQAFEFIWIKPGQFVMGAPPSDKLAEPEEKPQRLVQIEHGFYLGRTTVTVGQFRQFVLETSYKQMLRPINGLVTREAMAITQPVIVLEVIFRNTRGAIQAGR